MSETLRIVVGVAGHMGSGKTSVARRFESELGFQYLRYSQVLAEWLETDPNDKRRLQSVGGDIMARGGQEELNRRMIAKADPDRDVVVDGLRHPIDFESLRDEFADRFFLIFVDAPPEVRFQRLSGRFSSYEEFQRSDSKPVESHIDSLRPLACHVLGWTGRSEDMANLVREVVHSFRKKVAG